jgi:murein DD-endopeptidase MepM/ murein hydrolase activator NlpD
MASIAPEHDSAHRSPRRRRAALLVLVVTLVVGVPVSAASTGAGADSAGPVTAVVPRDAWVRPVPGELVHPFDPPAKDWLRGHRGVDLAAARGAAVASPAAGVVTFAGAVGGKPVVVVTHPGGLRSTLEPVDATVPRGTPVAPGSPVGTLSAPPGTADNPSHCAPADCLHWGVRRGERYLDPMALLGEAVPIVLLPLT